jgi:hypothetical protein
MQASRRPAEADPSAKHGSGEETHVAQAGTGLPCTPTACTVSLPGGSRLSGAPKAPTSSPKLMPSSGGKRRPLQAVPTFDVVAHTGGPLAAKDPLQHFALPERSGIFADMLSCLDGCSAGDTASPKLMVRSSHCAAGNHGFADGSSLEAGLTRWGVVMQAVQLHNLGHLFDDLDKAGSEVSECPETPLHLFPNTPTSAMLLQSQMFPEAQTPPQAHHPAHPMCRALLLCNVLSQACLEPLLSAPWCGVCADHAGAAHAQQPPRRPAAELRAEQHGGAVAAVAAGQRRARAQRALPPGRRLRLRAAPRAPDGGAQSSPLLSGHSKLAS